MYQFLVTGTILSIFLAGYASAEQDTNNTPHSEANPEILATFEEIKAAYAEDKDASTLVMNAVNNLPLTPQEKNINDFPAPLATDVQDPQSLCDYYTSIADAYSREWDRFYAQRHNAHDVMYEHKIDQTLYELRSNNRELLPDITNHQPTRTLYDKTVPMSSAKYAPSDIHRDAQHLQNRRYNEINNTLETLELKASFYADVADALSCMDASTAETQAETR